MKSREEENEEQLRQQKLNNVIIFNVPESTGEPEETKKSDIQKLKAIFKDNIEIRPEDIKTVYRKEQSKENTRPRPILMKFTTLEKKLEILKLRNLFCRHLNENVPIYINSDRTYNERMHYKKLHQQLKDRKASGEDNLTIRNGKIIKALPFRFDP